MAGHGWLQYTCFCTAEDKICSDSSASADIKVPTECLKISKWTLPITKLNHAHGIRYTLRMGSNQRGDVYMLNVYGGLSTKSIFTQASGKKLQPRDSLL